MTVGVVTNLAPFGVFLRIEEVDKALDTSAARPRRASRLEATPGGGAWLAGLP